MRSKTEPLPDRRVTAARLLRLLFGALLAVAVVCGNLYLAKSMSESSWTRQQPGLGAALAFSGLICVAVVFLIPTGPLTLGAGMMLGMAWGVPAVLAGMTLGSGISFLLGRFMLSGAAQRLMDTYPRLRKIHDAVLPGDWLLVFLIRLVPMFPSKPANYVFGASRVRFAPYMLASCAGYIPNTLAAVYAGVLARHAAGAAEGGTWTTLDWAVGGAGFLALLACVYLITKRSRRALGDRLGQ